MISESLKKKYFDLNCELMKLAGRNDVPKVYPGILGLVDSDEISVGTSFDFTRFDNDLKEWLYRNKKQEFIEKTNKLRKGKKDPGNWELSTKVMCEMVYNSVDIQSLLFA